MKIIVITMVLMLCFGSIYGYFRDKAGRRVLTFKALATGMAVFLGVYGTCTYSYLPGAMITVGLAFCMAADVVLEIHFIKGMFLFGAAHLCFIAAWSRIAGWGIITLVGFLAVYILILLLFRKDIDKLEELKIPAFLYVALLSLMAASAIQLYVQQHTMQSAFILAGALCFVISDCIIGFRTVRKKAGVLSGAAVLILYYAAVFLFGVVVYTGI